MGVQSLSLYNDSSTISYFTAWASAISSWFATCGWVQTADTGQVMWTGMSVTACSFSSGNSTYTYSSLTGLSLQNGRALAITGMTNAANNGTFVITSFTGTTSGTAPKARNGSSFGTALTATTRRRSLSSNTPSAATAGANG